MTRFCCLSVVLLFLVSAGIAGETITPDPATDTLSPVLEWKGMPYSWEEIQAGKLPLSPVHWTRFAGNPLVDRGMNPKAVLIDDKTLRVYYGRRGPGQGLFYFDVDPAEPGKLKAGPVGPIITTGKAGSYDEDWVLSPEPVRLSDTHLRMYYSAKRKGATFFGQLWSLAVADSYDNGKTWTKYAGNPILKTQAGTWENGAVGFGTVEKTDAGWKLWYTGIDTKAIKQVGYATSTDGLTWTRHPKNPVIAVRPNFHWEKGAVALPRVFKDGQLYKIWYCCYPQNNTYAVGQAVSYDGLHWFRSPNNPVLKGTGTGFDSQMTGYPCVIKVGDRYLMFYSGDGYGRDGLGLAMAETPGGTLLFRTGSAATPDENWSAWKPVSETEPKRTGHVQFAIIKDSE